ncbi:LysR family transcriptional regulator [Rhizobium sp. NZLR1b]|uniref:LysR family transcriptional regulator n=1 Tax=unclassified Rhizobium TaxID=2613769 RepID=UPI001C82D14C|nr:MULTISPECIES: LysR family transcriptional regulator [unclassified Rhizobium]MBX5173391.1 LysR family transcriptional regulator [Rhizobium sp. NZLR1b]MBX5192541.1 LysR family transcriptional regulator [Rhizobium sp. NZLR3b]
MDRLVLRDLAVFETVARHRSFTAAAAELGISQSSLSYAVSQLESRIGMALLARTTRNVSPTQAGQKLLDTLVPALQDIGDGLAGLQEMRTTISGSVRLTMVPVAYETILRPAMRSFRETFPNVSVEISIDEGLSEIVSDGFDGGIRFNTLIEKDMVSVPLTSSTAVSIVASPEYLEKRGVPLEPEELASHACIGYRYVSSGRLYRWPLTKGKQKAEYATDGSLVLNDGEAIRAAALDGLGLAYLFRSQVHSDIVSGKLVPVLMDWLSDLPGFSLYYPDRTRTAPAFRAMIDHLKHIHRSK